MDDNSPHHFDDEQDDGHHGGQDGYDDLSALDFSAPDDGSDSDLAALDDFVDYGQPAVAEAGVVEDSYVDDRFDDDVAAEDDELPVPLFTVSNPPGTVTVTTFLDGRINLIELSPRAARLTESQLADEIVVIARLATQDARSAQYAFMMEGMRQQGHDDAATRDFLGRDLNLPSPEDADRARASVFSTRYAGDHD